MNTAEVLAEVDELFSRCGATAQHPVTPKHDAHARAARSSSGTDEPPYRANEAMVTGLVAGIERNAPRRSYVDAALAVSRTPDGRLASTPVVVDRLLGILQSVRQDIEAGYVRDLETRARDELSGDLLATADSIVRMHAAPAIVLAVSVLEEHVRNLCAARNLATTKADNKHRSFEDMIADLLRAEEISSTEKRTMGGWYGERTAAAHGRFHEVTADEAPRVINGVRDFIVRHPQ